MSERVTERVNVQVVRHPLAQLLLTEARAVETSHADFRRCMAALSEMLIYEATAGLETTEVSVTTPLAQAEGTELAQLPLIVPILRAGLSMLDPAINLLPDALVAFMGMRRIGPPIDHEVYLSGLPRDAAGATALVLDPMLATGGSIVKTATLLAESGCGAIVVVCTLASPEGVAALEAAATSGPLAGFAGEISVVTASIDSHLDENAFIVPGLGDAGDRLYGEPPNTPH